MDTTEARSASPSPSSGRRSPASNAALPVDTASSHLEQTLFSLNQDSEGVDEDTGGNTAVEVMPAFRLLDLPDELQLLIVHAVDERDPSPTFPCGPSSDLLALSQTSTWFHTVCRPLIWRSIRYTPASPFRPPDYRERRNLSALWEILHARAAQQNPLPILCLSVSELNDEEEDLVDEDNPGLHEDESALVALVEALAASSLQVLFLKQMEIHQWRGARLLEAIAASPRLSALRFNQVDFYPQNPGVVLSFGTLQHIKTLQIMHSDPEIFDLVDKCPNVDSLLLWPSLRRIGKRIEAIKGLLPHLRNLSLDSVREAKAFRVIADEIIRLADAGTDLPLEELFLEGPCTAADLAVLVTALARLPALRRLALYQIHKPMPALVADLAAAAPQLRALTLVAGDCQEAVEWSAPLDDYLTQLSKFPSLRFFAWDRQSPRGVGEEDRRAVRQSQIEYATLSRLGGACRGLREAVCITSDVSEGSTGYFARYTPEKGKLRIHVKQQTVNDFLIGYDRWVQVEED
ncbi:hypothetical protein JCM10450v2_002290 [Rhodotorula kratochvilovae]